MQDFVNEGRLPSLFRRARKVRYHSLENWKFFKVSRIAEEKLPHRRRRKKCDVLTSQSNNFGVSRTRFCQAVDVGRWGLCASFNFTCNRGLFSQYLRSETSDNFLVQDSCNVFTLYM